jgi:hypothetical protein
MSYFDQGSDRLRSSRKLRNGQAPIVNSTSGSVRRQPPHFVERKEIAEEQGWVAMRSRWMYNLGYVSTFAFLFPVIYDTMQSCCKLQESISALEANKCDSLSLHSLPLQ